MTIQLENGMVFSYGQWTYQIQSSDCEDETSILRCLETGKVVNISWKFICESMLIGKKLLPQAVILPIETVQVKKFDRFEDIDL